MITKRKWSKSDTAKVIDMIRQGKKYREIAEEFDTTMSSVKQHMYNQFKSSDLPPTDSDTRKEYKSRSVKRLAGIKEVLHDEGLENRVADPGYEFGKQHRPGYSFMLSGVEIMVINVDWICRFFALKSSKAPCDSGCCFHCGDNCFKPTGYENCFSGNREDHTNIIFAEIPFHLCNFNYKVQDTTKQPETQDN